jgi:hypothetical protein
LDQVRNGRKRALLHNGFGRIKPPMTRFFDIADHDRLPWRFTALNRSVLARLG